MAIVSPDISELVATKRVRELYPSRLRALVTELVPLDYGEPETALANQILITDFGLETRAINVKKIITDPIAKRNVIATKITERAMKE